jgi:hypothetical protein
MHTFADMRWITAIGGCSVDINDIYALKLTDCDPFGRQGIGYPPMSLWAARILRLKNDHTPIISLSIAVGFIGVILSEIRSSFRSAWLLILVGSLFLVGFPVQLGLERMNIDILIFLLLYLSILLFSSHAFAWLLPLMIFVISLKYYPFFAFFALMLKGLPCKSDTKYSVKPWLILLIGSCIGLALSLPWGLGGANAVTIASGGLNSHGLTAMGFLNKPLIHSFGIANFRWILKAVFGIKILMLSSGGYMAWKLKLADILARVINIQTSQFRNICLPVDFYDSLVVAMTTVWLGCYISTISFDYRMIFLFPMLIFIARAIQLSPFIQINLMQIWGLICLLGAMLASMLIQFIANTPQDAAAQVGIDAIAEIILIPFYASALFVVVSSLIIMSRIRSGVIAQP